MTHEPQIVDKATEPKNTASTAAGAMSAIAVWAWNQYHAAAYEGCVAKTMGPASACVDWRLPDEIMLAAVVMITALTGPLLRRWEGWKVSRPQTMGVRELTEVVQDLAKEVRDLKQERKSM